MAMDMAVFFRNLFIIIALYDLLLVAATVEAIVAATIARVFTRCGLYLSAHCVPSVLPISSRNVPKAGRQCEAVIESLFFTLPLEVRARLLPGQNRPRPKEKRGLARASYLE